ncbi:MAG: DNA polymerase III subunit delta [Sphaerochaetaceae bacterium]|nr:DNA polymerase III subunit delta [Sphaerochaetaceae bacterium]
MESVYLLLGPEKGLKNDFIKRLKTSLGECEVSRFYAFEDYEDPLYAQLGSDDLFADRKLIILDEVQEIKTKDKISSLVSYMKNPSDSITLILSSPAMRVASEIMGAVPNQKEGIQRFYEMFDNKKEEWVRSFFARNSIRVSPDAVSAIISKVENNVEEFEVVCLQLVMYLQSVALRDNLTSEDVDDFLMHTKGEDEFSLFSLMARGEAEKSIECLRALLNSSESQSTTATLLAVRLSYFFRRALSLSNLTSSMPLDQAFGQKFYEDDRPITNYKQKTVYKTALDNYSKRDLERIMVLLAEYDIKIKEGGRLQNIMMEKCILDIVKGKGRHPVSVNFLKMTN